MSTGALCAKDLVEIQDECVNDLGPPHTTTILDILRRLLGLFIRKVSLYWP